MGPIGNLREGGGEGATVLTVSMWLAFHPARDVFDIVHLVSCLGLLGRCIFKEGDDSLATRTVSSTVLCLALFSKSYSDTLVAINVVEISSCRLQ